MRIGAPRIQQPLFDCFGVGTAVAGGEQMVGNMYAADKQAGAARDAARITADAATHGADLQDEAAKRTEAFNREQADYVAQEQEIDRHANYDQYAANRRRIGSISQAMGLGGVEVPGYVPGVVPHFANGPASGAPIDPRSAGPVAGPIAPPPASMPPNFGGALGVMGAGVGGTASAAAAMAPPGVDPRLMGGNTGVVAPPGTPQLQPDGTYAIVSSMPRYRSFGDYLGAA